MRVTIPDGQHTMSSASAAPELRLRRGEDRRLRAGHLWVFSNEIDVAATPLTAFAPGAHARLLSDRGQFLGHVYVNPHALICARVLSHNEQEPIDRALLVRRLRAALAWRERISKVPFYRLVFGESDGLPGLVLDRYDDVLVGQIATAGMEALRGELEAAIVEVLAPRALVWRNNSSARDLEQLPKEVTAAIGELPAELSVVEGGLHYTVPLADAQKTGWFFDQTSNRSRLAAFLPPGARVLDVCSYAGAWALTALAAGARTATCVDASAAALAIAQRNVIANGYTLEGQFQTHHGDAFEVLDALHAAGERFDAIILDPPAFIKRRKDAPRGQAAYRKLNHQALRLLSDEGLLVSCSCSYHIGEGELLSLIQTAARHAQRFVQVVAVGGQSPDHPLHPAIPETRYLKAFFCRVT
jgi:23S rRNA (cytosine1962-C5)-methyltransferase